MFDQTRSNGMRALDGPIFDQAFRDALWDLLAWRRDVRHFRPDPLPAGCLPRLIETAALAPSVGNSQPWRFVSVKRARERLAEHVDAANEAAAGKYTGDLERKYRSLKLHGIREAPEILSVFSDNSPRAGRGLGTATMAEALRYSTVMAINNLWLAARAEGIGVGWVSILEPEKVKLLLEVPESWSLVAVLCIGYPVTPSKIPELEERGWQDREPPRLFHR